MNAPGTLLLMSTAAQDLNHYEVWYSDDSWMKPIIDHEWHYVGKVHEVFGLRVKKGKWRRPSTAAP